MVQGGGKASQAQSRASNGGQFMSGLNKQVAAEAAVWDA